MSLELDQYEGLGRLLYGAGVDPVAAEALVANALANEFRKSREQVTRQVYVQVGDEIDRLDSRHRDISIDTRRLIATIRSHIEIHRQIWGRSHVVVRRIGILILAMQLAFAAMFAATFSHVWRQVGCVAAPMGVPEILPNHGYPVSGR